MEEELVTIYQTGALISWPKEKELQNSFKRSSSWEMLKTPNKRKLSYAVLWKLDWSKKYSSLSDGSLQKPIPNIFFISKGKNLRLIFNYFWKIWTIKSLTRKILVKRKFLSLRNNLYPEIVNSDPGKLESSFVSLTRKISKWFLIRGSRNALLFLNELILKWPKNKFLICFLRKSPNLEKPSVSLSVPTESSDTSVFTVLLPSLFWSLCQFSESRVFKRFTKLSLNSDTPLLFKCRPKMLQLIFAFNYHAWGSWIYDFCNNHVAYCLYFLPSR